MKAKLRKGKKGFTLIEAVVSVAVFAIAAVLFAMILFNATHMVNLSLVYDRDRIALTQAIETGSGGSITVVTVDNESGNDTDNKYEYFTIELKRVQRKFVDDKGVYYIYKAPSGRKYCIFVGSTDGPQEV